MQCIQTQAEAAVISATNEDLGWVFCVCTISPLSHPQTPFFHSSRSAICSPERVHWMGIPRITNGGP